MSSFCNFGQKFSKKNLAQVLDSFIHSFISLNTEKGCCAPGTVSRVRVRAVNTTDIFSVVAVLYFCILVV